MKIDVGDMSQFLVSNHKKCNREYIVSFLIYSVLIYHKTSGDHKFKGNVKYLKNIDTMFGTWATK